MDYNSELNNYWSSNEARNKYWDKRAQNTKEYKGESLYTITDIPFYMYRRKRLLTEMKDIDFRGKRVLDIGCGDGYYSVYFKQKFRNAYICGIDISEEMVHLARQRARAGSVDVKFSLTDGKNLAFKSRIFDLVYIFAVLQHIDDSKFSEYVKEVARIIKQNGKLIIFEAIGKEKGKGRMSLRRAPQDYIEIFQSHGLKLERYVCVSSPFYRRALIFVRGNRKFLSKLLIPFIVFLTRIVDKVWQDDFGNGFFVFTKH